MIKPAIVAYSISLVVTFIGLVIAGEFSSTVAIAASSITALCVLAWFQYKEKRVPEKNEFTKFYIVYSLLVFGSFFALVYLAPSRTTLGILSAIVLSVIYPGFMSILFNEKILNKQFEKKRT